MKRDMELVRKILLTIEDSEHGLVIPPFLKIEGYTDEQIGYHVHLMIQGGLLKGSDITSIDGKSPQAIPHSITWEGHEFIASARDAERWKQTRGLIDKVGGAAFSVWQTVLTHVVMKNIGVS